MGRFAAVFAALALGCAGVASAIAASNGALGGTTASASTTTGTVPSTTTTAPTLTSTAPAVLAFSGHGWGHGLGMSQYGAYGYAKHGWTYDRILAHYYSGTTLGKTTVKTVRVLLAQEKQVQITAIAPLTVTDSAGTKVTVPAGSLTFTKALVIAGQKPFKPPLTLTSKLPMQIDGRAYRGKLGLSAEGKLVDVIDTVALEDYVKGVVPAEMPSNWSPEALKAQAVATRSYALANVAKAKPFDLYGDTRSQEYGGVSLETPASDAAVTATKGQVVLWNAKVADTFFFSTSGGRTASALEAMGIDIPYLRPVADPYDTLSPYHDWGPVLLDARAVAKQLKLTAPVADVSATNGASGRVKSITFTGSDDSQTTVNGNQARALLDLRSTWFAPSLLSLQPSAKTMTYGGAVSLTGVVRGADDVSIESRQAGADWAPAGALVPSLDGTYATIVKPQTTTWYRLAWGDARVGIAKISVAARLVATPTTPGSVSGTVRPVVTGATVQLQEQQPAGGWTTVSSTTTSATGTWSFAGPIAAGTYRVRCAPGHGIAVGVSASFALA